MVLLLLLLLWAQMSGPMGRCLTSIGDQVLIYRRRVRKRTRLVEVDDIVWGLYGAELMIRGRVIVFIPTVSRSLAVLISITVPTIGVIPASGMSFVIIVGRVIGVVVIINIIIVIIIIIVARSRALRMTSVVVSRGGATTATVRIRVRLMSGRLVVIIVIARRCVVVSVIGIVGVVRTLRLGLVIPILCIRPVIGGMLQWQWHTCMSTLRLRVGFQRRRVGRGDVDC